jgi:hypothetical protein
MADVLARQPFGIRSLVASDGLDDLHVLAMRKLDAAWQYKCRMTEQTQRIDN